MNYRDIQFDVEDGIGFTTLNRPEKRNALFLNSMAEMTDLLKSISKNAKVWVLIIRAQGLGFSVANSVLSSGILRL